MVVRLLYRRTTVLSIAESFIAMHKHDMTRTGHTNSNHAVVSAGSVVSVVVNVVVVTVTVADGSGALT